MSNPRLFPSVVSKHERLKCLRCRGVFLSSDRRSNRICPECRKTNNRASYSLLGHEDYGREDLRAAVRDSR